MRCGRGRFHQHLSCFLKTLHDWGGNPNVSEPALSPLLLSNSHREPVLEQSHPGVTQSCWFPEIWLTVSPLADDQAEDGQAETPNHSPAGLLARPLLSTGAQMEGPEECPLPSNPREHQSSSDPPQATRFSSHSSSWCLAHSIPEGAVPVWRAARSRCKI